MVKGSHLYNSQTIMTYAIKYPGVLTEMWVIGFSEPMDVGTAEYERSVKASSRRADAHLFAEHEIADALALTRRCHPKAEKVEQENER